MQYRFTLLGTDTKPEALLHLLDIALEETMMHFPVARIKLETSYSVEPENKHAFIEGGTPVGEHLAEAMSGLLRKQFGPEGFKVDRLVPAKKKPNPTKSKGAWRI